MSGVRINDALVAWSTVWVHQDGKFRSGFDIARKNQGTWDATHAGANESDVWLHQRFFGVTSDDVLAVCTMNFYGCTTLCR